MAPKERIEELREKLNEYNRLYYVENTPAVSDRQFDEMLRELQELEQRYPEYYDDEPFRGRPAPLSDDVAGEHLFAGRAP